MPRSRGSIRRFSVRSSAGKDQACLVAIQLPRPRPRPPCVSSSSCSPRSCRAPSPPPRSPSPHHDLIVVEAPGGTLAALAAAGYDIVGGKPGVEAKILATAAEQARLTADGYRFVVEQPDLESFYAARDGKGIGFGAFHTYSETMDQLDALHAAYPTVTTAKYAIGTTSEGRTVWALKVSDNPDVEERRAGGAVRRAAPRARADVDRGLPAADRLPRLPLRDRPLRALARGRARDLLRADRQPGRLRLQRADLPRRRRPVAQEPARQRRRLLRRGSEPELSVRVDRPGIQRRPLERSLSRPLRRQRAGSAGPDGPVARASVPDRAEFPHLQQLRADTVGLHARSHARRRRSCATSPTSWPPRTATRSASARRSCTR